MVRKLALLFSCFVLGDCSVTVLDPRAGVQIERFSVGKPELVLEVHKTHAHPFLAEYDFKLVLKSAEREIDSQEMTGDSGGLGRIDVLRTSNVLYAFRDYGRSVCLEVDHRKLIPDCDPVAGVRIGRLDFDSARRWRYISDAEGGF